MRGPIRFDGFSFDPATGELRRGDSVVRLEPQPARALALLLSRPGELVTREELRAHLWPDDVSVDFDRGLAYCLSQIRSALGDTADAPRFVETLPRRGYRFVAVVESTASPRPWHAQQTASAAVARVAAVLMVTAVAAWGIWSVASQAGGDEPARVLAVAVFDNETGDPAFDLAVAGFSDGIVGKLVDLSDARIAVAGQNRVLRLPRSERDLEQIAADTGATHAVLGQLQRRGADLVVYAHLIDLADGRHVWGGTFPVVDGQVGSLHLQVADALDAAVRERLLGTGR